MRPMLLLQISFLLISGQLILGLIGFAVRSLPWLGLLPALLLTWFIVRTANVFRTETVHGKTWREQQGRPGRWRLLGIAVLWQLPGLLALLFWTSPRATEIWQGAFLTVPHLLARWWPAAGAAALAWLWVAALVELVLFVWLGGRTEQGRRPVVRVAVGQQSPGTTRGDWVPAMRHREKRVDLYGDEGEKKSE